MDFCSIYFKTGPAIVLMSHILGYRYIGMHSTSFQFFHSWANTRTILNTYEYRGVFGGG